MTPGKPELTFFSRTTSIDTQVPLGSSPQSEIRSFHVLVGHGPHRCLSSGPTWYCDSRGSFSLPGASLVPCRSGQGATRRWASKLILEKSIPTTRVSAQGLGLEELPQDLGLGLCRWLCLRLGLRLRVA